MNIQQLEPPVPHKKWTRAEAMKLADDRWKEEERWSRNAPDHQSMDSARIAAEKWQNAYCKLRDAPLDFEYTTVEIWKLVSGDPEQHE